MRSPAAALAALVLLAAASPAAADEGPPADPPPAPAPTRSMWDRSPPRPAPKSGATATGLAIGGTVAGFALMAVGGQLDSEELGYLGLGVAVVGPSAGHLYAGENLHTLVTSSIRGASVATLVTGAVMSFCLFDCEDKDVDDRRNGELLVFTGLGLYTATTIYDLVDAHQAAQRANRRLAAAAVPAVLTSPDGSRAPGMVLAGSF